MSQQHRVEVGKGYAFAYYAWMRQAPPGTYRHEQAARSGVTFFHTFASMNLVSYWGGV